MDNEIELISGAIQSFDRVAAGLALLEKNYKGILYDTETSLGMDMAKAARAAIRDPRYEVERIRKSAKAPLLTLGKRLDSEANRITLALLAVETPIDDQIKERERAIEDEKRRKAEAEIARVAEIQAKVEAIRNMALSYFKTSAAVACAQADADLIEIDESYAEFADSAINALQTTKAALKGIHAERFEHEAAQAKLKADQEELTRLRAEQIERDRLAAIEKVKQDAQDKAEREAHAKADREARAQQEAADKALRDAENAKLAQARAELEREEREAHERQVAQAREHAQKIAADQARIDAERAEFERLKKPIEVKPRVRPAPPLDEVIAILMERYSVDRGMVVYWLSTYRFTEAAA